MKSTFFSAVLLAIASLAHADLLTDFKLMEQQSKGPFDLNYLQGTEGRVKVDSPVMPAGSLLFQAAFRNDAARALITNHDFYVGNLFSTNYYELMGEYVYGDAYGSHAEDHSKLVEQSVNARTKAVSMVRNWVLEKYYTSHFTESKLARSFRYRGISGSEFEQVYAKHFFNFYLSAINNDFQYLPAFLLAANSPIGESSSLEKARNLVAANYDSYLLKFEANDPKLTRLYRIRNAIHNRLSPEVLTEIDAYLKDFPTYKEESNSELFTIRDLLTEYYSFSVSKIVKQAQKLQLTKVESAAEELRQMGANTDRLSALAMAVAELRSGMSAISYDKKAATLVLIANTSRYLSKEISLMTSLESTKTVGLVVDAVYLEGFLIKDNWEYFKSEILAAADVPSALNQIPDIIDIANDTFTGAFAPALSQWQTIEPKMLNFTDNTIKSSALNTASVVVERFNK